MRKSISELIDEYEAARNVDRDLRVGPSDYGKCPRQIMYRVTGHVPGEPRELTRAATMGTLFWEGLGAFISKMYPEAAHVEERVQVPGLNRSGSADLRWVHDGELVDVKTVSDRSFDYTVSMGAKPENIGQLETYALGINRAETKAGRSTLVNRLTLAYVNRDNGDVHEVTWPYDERSAREKVSWLVSQEEAIDAGLDMPRAAGARLGAFPCDWCPFWRECWDVQTDDVPDDYASKFTVTDDQIEDAIERYFEASEVESKAKRIKAEARDQLVGVHYDTPKVTLKWSGGREKTETVIDYDEAVVQLQLAGRAVPTKEVSSRTARRISLKRKVPEL